MKTFYESFVDLEMMLLQMKEISALTEEEFVDYLNDLQNLRIKYTVETEKKKVA